MKKKIAALVLALCLAAGAGGAFFLRQGGALSDSDNVVYVGAVSQVGNPGSGFALGNRYAGVVESENVWKVKKSPERTVKEVAVETGQEVKKGEVLFTYDIDEELAKIEQGKLDLERIANEKTTMASNIAELEKERKKTSGDQKTTLTLEIQQAQLDLKKKDFEAKEKQNEIDKLQMATENSAVCSEIDGIIKSINDGSGNMDFYEGQDDSFITVVSVGSYQIKGKINEQNLGNGELMEGMPVLVHSRVDESITWSGIVDRIDMENASNSNNNFYYGDSDSMLNTSSYPFYVKLDSNENLMLGQHVFVEVDFGGDNGDEREGLWISSFYVNDPDGDAYVWADNGKGKLEKRSVTLGEQDDEMGLVQILDGLGEEDYITWPEEGLEEGMPTVRTSDGVMGQSNPDFGELEFTDGEFMEGEFTEGEFTEGEFTEGEFTEGEWVEGEEMPVSESGVE